MMVFPDSLQNADIKHRRSTMRRTLALGLFALMAIAGNAFGQAQSRITGKVVDAKTKAGIADAVIKVEALSG
jgi:hypothetical protein